MSVPFLLGSRLSRIGNESNSDGGFAPWTKEVGDFKTFQNTGFFLGGSIALFVQLLRGRSALPF